MLNLFYPNNKRKIIKKTAYCRDRFLDYLILGYLYLNLYTNIIDMLNTIKSTNLSSNAWLMAKEKSILLFLISNPGLLANLSFNPLLITFIAIINIFPRIHSYTNYAYLMVNELFSLKVVHLKGNHSCSYYSVFYSILYYIERDKSYVFFICLPIVFYVLLSNNISFLTFLCLTIFSFFAFSVLVRKNKALTPLITICLVICVITIFFHIGYVIDELVHSVVNMNQSGNNEVGTGVGYNSGTGGSGAPGGPGGPGGPGHFDRTLPHPDPSSNSNRHTDDDRPFEIDTYPELNRSDLNRIYADGGRHPYSSMNHRAEDKSF
jgi:hypothetical protein